MNGRNITKIVRNMQLYKNKQNVGLTINDNEYEMIRYLTKRNGLSQMDLAFYLNVDKSLVTRMTKKLEKLGYITTSVDSKDARRKILQVTSKGLCLKQESVAEEVLFYKTVLKCLTPQEQIQLDELIEKVYLESKKLRKNKFVGVGDEESFL